MRLLRVQVPEFRALKDVDITFEKDFTPAVFPVGSQNGGGKSTLLQLIFTLLHCSFHSDREQFLKNILQDFKVGHELKLLAKLHILDADTEIILEFLASKNNKEIEFLTKDGHKHSKKLEFSSLQKLEQLNKNLSHLEKVKKSAFCLKENIKNEDDFDPINFHNFMNESLHVIDLISEDKNIYYQILSSMSSASKKSLFLAANKILDLIPDIEHKISQILGETSFISENLYIIIDYLEEEKLNFICTYESSKNNEGVLLLRYSGKNTNIKELLQKISEKVFLAAPSTQIFIFTPKESQKLLFERGDRQDEYYSFVKNTESHLLGLFTYDFISVDLLIDAFKAARDKDFEAAIKYGMYGHSYQDLINDLNHMLGNKKINISPDLSEITFKLSSNSGEEIDLYPENLSHGELKRLSLYMWLRSRLIENSIVLMDEVEIAFHPDWQYQIVSDLAHWAPSNQYILATHSYELCQAVTPAHVKELEPKLLKTES
jgi:AAA domain, putative AbiEii toxin, Type IV TA system